MRSKVKRIAGFEVERHAFAFVEEELRRYPARKQEIARAEADAIHRTPKREPGMPKSGRLSDPTFTATWELERNHRLQLLRVWCQAVENTLQSLPPELQDIIREAYFTEGATPEGVALKLHLSPATFWRHRNQALLPFVVTLVGDHVMTYSA